MNDYESRQEEKRERYEELAEKAKREGESRWQQSKRLSDCMNGQPILIGHHSEKRHRRDIERMDTHLHKSVDAGKKADYYERKAAGVGRAGISSDDPAALIKLREKLTGLEASRDSMKRHNALWRKAGKPRGNLGNQMDTTSEIEDATKWDKLEALDSLACSRIRTVLRNDFMHRAPFSYGITNTGSEIRRIAQRIEQLELAATEPDHDPIEGEGFRVYADREENRVCFEFPGKPSAEIRTRLKSRGFRWNRRLVAWTRHNNGEGWAAAQWIAESLDSEG